MTHSPMGRPVDPLQARLLDEMRARRYVESAEMAKEMQSRCWPYFLPGFVAVMALAGLFLQAFMEVEKYVWMMAVSAVLGFVWLVLVAPRLAERWVVRGLGYDVRYFGQGLRTSYSAFIDHPRRRFCIWDGTSFNVPYRYWTR